MKSDNVVQIITSHPADLDRWAVPIELYIENIGPLKKYPSGGEMRAICYKNVYEDKVGVILRPLKSYYGKEYSLVLIGDEKLVVPNSRMKVL